MNIDARRRRARATVLASTALAAVVATSLAGPAVSPARAATSALAGPVLVVARGTSTGQSSGWRFSERYAAEIPAGGLTITIVIRTRVGPADGISFVQSSPPQFVGPGSLQGSAAFVDRRTLRIDLAASHPGQVESFDVTGLRLAASVDAGLGPVDAAYGTWPVSVDFGPLPSIAGVGSPVPTASPSPTATPSPTPTPSPAPSVVRTTAFARVALGAPASPSSPPRQTLTAKRGAMITVRATVRPADVGRELVLYRRYGTTGGWTQLVRVAADASGGAAVATRASLPAGWHGPRRIEYRWSVPAIASRSAAWSDVAVVVVR